MTHIAAMIFLGIGIVLIAKLFTRRLFKPLEKALQTSKQQYANELHPDKENIRRLIIAATNTTNGSLLLEPYILAAHDRASKYSNAFGNALDVILYENWASCVNQLIGATITLIEIEQIEKEQEKLKIKK